MTSRAPGTPPKTAPSAPSTAGWGNSYVPPVSKAPYPTQFEPQATPIYGKPRPAPPPGDPPGHLPKATSTRGHPWGVGEDLPWTPAPPTEPPPRDNPWGPPPKQPTYAQPAWTPQPPREPPPTDHPRWPPPRQPEQPMEPPPPHLRQAKFKAAPPAPVAETFDVDWLRELISHSLMTAHASRMATGNFTAYAKIFYRVMFGLAATERPEGLTEEDLKPNAYRGLHGTHWWTVFSSPLPILLRHFIPLIYDRMGRRIDESVMNVRGRGLGLRDSYPGGQ